MVHLTKLEELVASNSDTKKAFRTCYTKKELMLKGFAMSLQTGKFNLGGAIWNGAITNECIGSSRGKK